MLPASKSRLCVSLLLQPVRLLYLLFIYSLASKKIHTDNGIRALSPTGPQLPYTGRNPVDRAGDWDARVPNFVTSSSNRQTAWRCCSASPPALGGSPMGWGPFLMPGIRRLCITWSRCPINCNPGELLTCSFDTRCVVIYTAASV